MRREREPLPHPASWALCLATLAACSPSEPTAAAAPPDVPLSQARAGGFEVLEPQNPAYPVDLGLGEITYGETVRHVVRLLNRETGPLGIKSVVAGCACTTPRIATTAADGTRVVRALTRGAEPLSIAPGGVAELELEVDSVLSPARNTPKRVMVRIESDSAVDPYLTLEVHFTVVFPFQITPAIVQLGPLAVNGGGAGTTDILPIGAGGERVTSVLECPARLECSLAPLHKAGFDLWQLEVRWLPPLALGVQTRVVRLGTTGPGGAGEGRPLEIQIVAHGVPDVTASPTRLVFPAPDEPSPELATVEILSRLAGQRLVAERGELEGEGVGALKVAFVPLDPDAEGRATRIQVRLELDLERAPESFAGTLTVHFAAAGSEPLAIPYVRLAR